MEFHVRSARLPDVDAAIRILLRDAVDPEERRGDADRLRSLLFVPAATVIVAEVERRIVGVGVLSIRPAVRTGPFIGFIDELEVEGRTGRAERAAAAADAANRDRVRSSILEQLITSARNKGCVSVEVADPLARAESALFKRADFARRGTLLSRAIG